jgi:hypothetical protein
MNDELKDALVDIAKAASMPKSDQAYARFVSMVRAGEAITLTDHELVLAAQRAIHQHEPATAHLALCELEIRTAADALLSAERRAA